MPSTLSDLEITQTIENNQYEFFLEIAQTTGFPWHSDESISWVDCSPSPSPVGIMNARVVETEADALVKSVKRQIKAGSMPGKWMTGPTNQPDNLENILNQNGFIRRSETIGMALDLTQALPESEIPAGLEVCEANQAELPQWAQIVGLSLFACSETASAAFGEVMGAMLTKKRVRAYIAALNGIPAAASMVYFSEGIAGIYYVATLEQYRGMGIGFCITRTPLLLAQASGYTTAILQATALGARVYHKLGFKPYSLLGRYWLPENE